MDPVPFIAEVFSRCARRFFPSLKPRTKAEQAAWLGRRGETLASRHLKQNGYKVLWRNFRGPRGGEVDIVCRDKSCATLVFVEVKTRSSRLYGSPADAVDLQKQRLIARGALAWLRLLHFPAVPFRFDIVEVLIEPSGTSLHIIQNAFQLPDPLIY
jgi:putative endonuclease